MLYHSNVLLLFSRMTNCLKKYYNRDICSSISTWPHFSTKNSTALLTSHWRVYFSFDRCLDFRRCNTYIRNQNAEGYSFLDSSFRFDKRITPKVSRQRSSRRLRTQDHTQGTFRSGRCLRWIFEPSRAN